MDWKTLSKAIQFRKDSQPDQAPFPLTELLKSKPNNPAINYQMARTCDFMGKESEAVFDQAINEFLEDRSLKVFRALTPHNLGKSEDAVRQILMQLPGTTSDYSIKTYDKALRFYSDELSEKWA